MNHIIFISSRFSKINENLFKIEYFPHSLSLAPYFLINNRIHFLLFSFSYIIRKINYVFSFLKVTHQKHHIISVK